MANGLSKEPTQNYMQHLKDREGTLDVIYKDTSGFATGGTGHLFTGSDKAAYGINESTKYVDYPTKYGMRQAATDVSGKVIKLDVDVTDDWLKTDSTKHYEGGKAWSKELGLEGQEIVDKVSAVNFQFPAFKEKMPSAWGAIKSGDMGEAINHMKFVSGIPGTEKSDWFDETPDRVEDFASALRSYGESVKNNPSNVDRPMAIMQKEDEPLITEQPQPKQNQWSNINERLAAMRKR